MKSAVCLLLPASSGLYWAVSRRNDTTQWGLPGGKVDPGESFEQAVLRETSEEMGLFIPSSAEAIPIYSAVCPGKGPGDTYWVTTYLWMGAVDGNALTPEEGIEIRTLCEKALTDPKACPFAAYNVGVFNALRAYMGQPV